MGSLLLIMHIAAGVMYALAVVSGWRALIRLRPVALFRWAAPMKMLALWAAPAPIPEDGNERAWPLIWIAVYFSFATCAVALLLLLRLMAVSDYSSPSRVAFYYLPMHYGQAIGAIALHVGAAVLISSRRGQS